LIDLGPLERAIIQRYQGGFPLTPRPFAQAAMALDTEEAHLIATLKQMLEDGWLSRFGPLYNAERLGGGVILAALAVPEGDFARVAAQVNGFPEVAHNYRREHALNMWFVVATESPQAIGDTLHRIEAATGLTVYRFPKEREFYLGLWFTLEDPAGCLATRPLPYACSADPPPLEPLDRALVAATQGGLPLLPAPFDEVARRLGTDPPAVLGRFQRMLATGVIRRIGVVPNHYRLGFRANGMAVWDVPDAQIARIGEQIGALAFVSHCYQRTRCPPLWPYNLFTMVHGPHREAVRDRVAEIAALVGRQSRNHTILFSNAILKKTGLRLT
jgi:DNA-binding Lrp family transcriptional regulator